MTKKELDQLKEIIAGLPTPNPVTISNVKIDMTDNADKALAEAAGKLADALKAIAERPKNGPTSQTGIRIEQGPRQ
jgi:hypothetical protein